MASDPSFAPFLATAGWGHASITAITGDASSRRYFRLHLGTATAVLMDAGPAGGTRAFATIGAHLRGLGLSAPKVLAVDHAGGLMLLEDLGDALFSTLLDRDPGTANRLYSGAIDVLVRLAGAPPPPGLARLNAPEMATIARMVIDWYQPAATGQPATGADDLAATIAHTAAPLIGGPPMLMLRDYHAGNLIWLPDRNGPARVGLLDYQDAMAAHPAYDLASLLQDARRDVPPDLEAAMLARYAKATGHADISAAYAMMAAQRALRIMGIFARLCLHFAKPQYLTHLPRVYRQLYRNLAHPALADLASLCDRLVPEPTIAILNRIKSQCGTAPHP